MKYNELNITRNRAAKRVGRGISAGQGKTAGRGTKGQGARTGSTKRPGFAGGQNPLMQKLPKLPGFRSTSTKAELVYTGQLDQFAGKTVDAHVLADKGLVSNAYVKIKLLSQGDITKKVIVKVQAASAAAVEAVEKAGGSVDIVGREARQKKPTTKKPGKKEA